MNHLAIFALLGSGLVACGDNTAVECGGDGGHVTSTSSALGAVTGTEQTATITAR